MNDSLLWATNHRYNSRHLGMPFVNPCVLRDIWPFHAIYTLLIGLADGERDFNGKSRLFNA